MELTLLLFTLLLATNATESVLEEPYAFSIELNEYNESLEVKERRLQEETFSSFSDRSWVEFYFGGTKEFLGEGDILETSHVTVTVEFIGLQNEQPVALIRVNEESAFLGNKEEKYFSDGYILVREVHYSK